MRVLSVELVRARERLEPDEFLALSCELSVAELVEVGDIIVAERWDAYPYLAAIFARLVEAQQEQAVWAFIERHRAYLADATPAWTVVAHTITTTRVGDRVGIQHWFAGWEQRPHLPLWVIASLGANLVVSNHDSAHTRFLGLLEQVPGRAIPDITEAFFRIHRLARILRAGRFDEFIAAWRDAPVAAPDDVLAHPMLRYVNGVKRTPITAADLAYVESDPVTVTGLALKAARGTPNRPFDWRTVALVRDVLAVQHRPWLAATKMFPIIATLIQTRRGDPDAVRLYRLGQKSGLKNLPGAAQVGWDLLVRDRISAFTRFKLAFVANPRE